MSHGVRLLFTIFYTMVAKQSLRNKQIRQFNVHHNFIFADNLISGSQVMFKLVVLKFLRSFPQITHLLM